MVLWKNPQWLSGPASSICPPWFLSLYVSSLLHADTWHLLASPKVKGEGRSYHNLELTQSAAITSHLGTIASNILLQTNTTSLTHFLLYLLAFLLFLFSYFLLFKPLNFNPDWCGSVGWESSHKQKSFRFDSRLGHIPGLRARSRVGQFSCTSLFLSLFLLPFHSL